MRPAAVIDVMFLCMCMCMCMFMCKKHTRVRTGVFPLKEMITVHRFVRFMNHRSLKSEIFPTPVNETRCFRHLSGVVHSASIGVSDGIASSRCRLLQPVPLIAGLLILNIEPLNMPAHRLHRPLFLQSVSTVIALSPTTIPIHSRFIIGTTNDAKSREVKVVSHNEVSGYILV